jgi:hypothetical protein
MITSVSETLELNTPRAWTVIGVGPWMDTRARVRQGPFTHPHIRFPTSVSPQIRGHGARVSRVSEILKFSFSYPFARPFLSARLRQKSRMVSQRLLSGSSIKGAVTAYPFQRGVRRGQDGVGARPGRIDQKEITT